MPRRIVKFNPRYSNLRNLWFNVNFIAVALLYSITARGQPAVEDRPFTENHRHQLSCSVERNVRWNCSWAREDDAGTFHPVKVNTEFVTQGPLPADLDVCLNNATKGTYRCSCQVNAEQTDLMKVIFFYSADQRFQNFPGNVTVEEGKLFNLTVCYLKHLPESVNLTKIALVEEATGNPTLVNLDRTNYCAQFPLQDPQPGTYHLKAAVHYGNIISRSFHIGVVQPPTEATDEETQPPTGATSYDARDGTTTAVMAAVIPIVVLILLVLGVCATIGGCVWRRKREDGQEHMIEDRRQPAQPPPNPSPSVHQAPADDPVNAGDQEIHQQLSEAADVHAGAIHDEIHHTHDNSHEPLWRHSVASNEDRTSVCYMPTEETATASYPRPTQVEDNSGGAQLTVKGMRRLSTTSEAAPTLMREAHPTEVHAREPPNRPMQEGGYDSQ